MIVNGVLSTLLQLGVVLLVCVAVWAATARKRQRFFPWLGLQAVSPKTAVLALGIGVVSAGVLLAVPAIRELSSGATTVVGKVMQDGWSLSSAVVLALFAVFKTSLSEELLFRGLIGKRLIARVGFAAGNAIQAVLFGAIHLLLLLVPDMNPLAAWMLVFFTGIMGWVNGALNEKFGAGSIVPGWIAHAAANLAAYFILAWIVG